MVRAANGLEGPGGDVAASITDGSHIADVAMQHFRSRDPDETQAFLRAFGHQLKVPHGNDPFAYELAGVASRGLTVVHINVAARQAMRATDSAPIMFLPLQTGYTFNIGRKAWQPNPAKAIFVAPEHEYSVLAPAGAVLGLRIDLDLLGREIAGRMRGRSRALLLKSVAFPIYAGRLATIRTFYDRMFAAAKGGQPWGVYHNVDNFEAEAASWVAGMLLDQAGVRAAPAGGLQRIERLERWLDAHLGEVVTLDQLCAVSGVRARTLQRLTLARYGQSPLEWVDGRRLAAARALLLRAAPGVAISSVALDCGFTHLGRFSAAYRRAHGELPSATVSMARSKIGEKGIRRT
jgi:AraC-like DNA-binding protein